jgi:uncharacterized protein YndB with AHSA1/START domain
MTPATIRKEIQIAAPIAHVWQFIGSEEGLRRWWGVDIRLEPRQSGRWVERGFHNGAPYQLSGVVSVYDPPQRIVLLMSDEQDLAAFPTYMHIAITLSETEKFTLVQIVHQFYSTQPIETSHRQPGPEGSPPAPSPVWAPPAILNQLPGRQQPGTGSSVGANSTATTRPLVGDSDHAWMSQQEARWSAGLVTLMQVVQQRKESAS